MLLFLKVVDETQMPNPPEATRHHDQENYRSYYPSEPFRITRFTMRHPVSEKDIFKEYKLWGN